MAVRTSCVFLINVIGNLTVSLKVAAPHASTVGVSPSIIFQVYIKVSHLQNRVSLRGICGEKAGIGVIIIVNKFVFRQSRRLLTGDYVCNVPCQGLLDPLCPAGS